MFFFATVPAVAVTETPPMVTALPGAVITKLETIVTKPGAVTTMPESIIITTTLNIGGRETSPHTGLCHIYDNVDSLTDLTHDKMSVQELPGKPWGRS